MNKELIQSLLDKFYSYISFAEGEEPDFVDFKELFTDDALVIQYADDNNQNYIKKDISTHIGEMEKVFNDYPVIKSKGFHEEEIDNTINLSGPIALVESRYRKKYFNGSSDIVGVGTNCMQILTSESGMKIVSVVFYEG